MPSRIICVIYVEIRVWMSVEHEQSDMKTSENEIKGLTVFFPGLDHQCLFSRIGCLFFQDRMSFF